MSERSEWVERFLKITLTEFQKTTVNMICAAMRRGPYDFSSTFKNAAWNDRSVKFNIPVHGTLATFDSDGLTALIILAHDNAIRVEIEPCNPRHLTVWMHQRAREETRLHLRHPTIEEAILRVRS